MAQTLLCALLRRGVVLVARPSRSGQCPSLAFPPRRPECGVASRWITMETTNTNAYRRRRRRCAWVFKQTWYPRTCASRKVRSQQNFSPSLLSFSVSLSLRNKTYCSRFLCNLHLRWGIDYIKQGGPETDRGSQHSLHNSRTF